MAYPDPVRPSLRIPSVRRTDSVVIHVNGFAVQAYPGESVATALMALGERRLGAGPDAARPRTVFCMMGVCQQCLVTVDGAVVQGCLTPVQAGMTVDTR